MSTPDTVSGAPELAPTVDRINVEPSVINGLTETEVTTTAFISLVVGALVGLMVSLWTGVWMFFSVITLTLPCVMVWRLSLWFAALKRNKPDGYHTQWLRLRLAGWGLKQCGLIQHDGYWSIGRPL